VIDATRRHGFDGIELNVEESGPLSLETSPDDATRIAERVRRAGLEIPAVASGLYWTRSLSSENPAERQAGLGLARQQIRLAAAMRVTHILVVPGGVDVFFMPERPRVPYETAYKNAQQSLRLLAEEAEAAKVVLCLENVWSRFLLSPIEFARFIDDIQSLLVRAYFDAGNVLAFGYPEDWIRVLGTRISRVHVKDFKRAVATPDGFCLPGEGDVNWSGVMASLRATAYDGWLTAEVFKGRGEDPEDFLTRLAAAMDRVMRQ
jgi:hexulose-6-phosphate isomerase